MDNAITAHTCNWDFFSVKPVNGLVPVGHREVYQIDALEQDVIFVK